MAWFRETETYYAILFHQLIHSTGHKSRLHRKEIDMVLPGKIGHYSAEELAAQMGTCYLSSFCGIDEWDFQNRFECIAGWVKALRTDKRMVVFAAAQAQLAVDYILNLHGGDGTERINEEKILQTIAI